MSVCKERSKLRERERERGHLEATILQKGIEARLIGKEGEVCVGWGRMGCVLGGLDAKWKAPGEGLPCTAARLPAPFVARGPISAFVPCATTTHLCIEVVLQLLLHFLLRRRGAHPFKGANKK